MILRANPYFSDSFIRSKPMLQPPFSLFIVFYLLLPFIANAQNEADTLTYFPNDRIRGGAPTFYDTMQYMLGYPSSGYEKHTVGTTIAILTITPQGEMKEVKVLSSLGLDFDRMVHQALSATQHLWLADRYVKNDVALVIPISFVLKGTQYKRATPRLDFLMPEIVVISHTMRRIREDIFLVTKANHLYIEKKYRRAMKYLDELIRRNPYDKNLFIMRGTARHQTGNASGACDDFNMVTTLLRQPLPAEARTLCP